jgi:hypothetical protein
MRQRAESQEQFSKIRYCPAEKGQFILTKENWLNWQNGFSAGLHVWKGGFPCLLGLCSGNSLNTNVAMHFPLKFRND